MQWPNNTIWWHVYPLRFTHAERTAVDEVHHRLAHLENWLDYAIELGANGLLLGPMFASHTHGYDTIDYYRVDPRLGDDADVDQLFAAAKARGFRILLDGVFNHVGRDHPIAIEALRAGRHTDAGAMMRWANDDYLYAFEGHDILVELNHENPAVQDMIVDVMCHWLERGIDGWRLDAAYAAGPAAWRKISDRVHERFPEAWLMGEVIHGDYPAFIEESGLDSLTQYEVWKATWSSINDVNFGELDWQLRRHAHFMETFVPLTFVGNHDVTRVRTKITDDRHLQHAVALLAMLPGIPAIYSGDEQGFTGEKTESGYGDDAVRPPFPDTPAELLEFGRDIYELHQRLFGLRRQHPWLWTAATKVMSFTNSHIVLEFAAEQAAIRLSLNIGDEAVEAPGGEVLLTSDGDGGVTPAHGWVISAPSQTG